MTIWALMAWIVSLVISLHAPPAVSEVSPHTPPVVSVAAAIEDNPSVLVAQQPLASPRGISNHNPGNIRYTGIPWQGLASDPSDSGGSASLSLHTGALGRLPETCTHT